MVSTHRSASDSLAGRALDAAGLDAAGCERGSGGRRDDRRHRRLAKDIGFMACEQLQTEQEP